MEPTEKGTLKRWHYGAGLVLWLGLAVDGAYVIGDEWSVLTAALERGQVLVRFHNTILFFPGAMIGLASLIAISCAGLVKWSPPVMFHKVTQWSFVVAVAVAFSGMFFGGMAVDRYVEGRGYQYCGAKSEYSLLRQHRAWTLDPMICDTDAFPDTMTLKELREVLRDIPLPHDAPGGHELTSPGTGPK